VQFVKKIGIFVVSTVLVGCAGIDLRQITGQTSTAPAPTAPVVVAPPVPSVPSVPPAAPLTYYSDMQSYKVQVARKIMQANGSTTFTGKLPDPMASIPIIEITLNADGSIFGLDVRRTPRFFPETVQTAMAAIRRAAPFGPVSNLPQPWVFNETFLFNDDLKFQLLTLQP
jgi:outer membrane biosynthesis protein TonB